MFANCQVRQGPVGIRTSLQYSFTGPIGKLTSAIGNASRSFEEGPSLREVSNGAYIYVTRKRVIDSLGGLSGNLILVSFRSATSLLDTILRIRFRSLLMEYIFCALGSGGETICFARTGVFSYRGLVPPLAISFRCVIMRTISVFVVFVGALQLFV